MNRRAIATSCLALAALAGAASAQVCPDVEKLGNFFTPGADDLFGACVSMSFGGLNNSPLLAVGRPNDDAPNAGDDAGGFAVYQKINGWSLMYDSWNTTGQGGERLGSSIGLSDPYLICGAPEYNSGQGRARVYRRPPNGSGYAFAADLVALNNVAGARFGEAVAVSAYGGGWAVVGAPLHDFHGEIDSGAAFFFARDSATGQWNPVYQIWGGDFGGDSQDHRGAAVAMAQQTEFAAVGSPNYEDANAPQDHGAVRVVHRLANGLPSGQSKKIVPPDPEAGEHFGAAVAIENDLLVVGSPDEDMTLQEGGFVQQAIDCGAIYIFKRNGQTGEWDFVAKLRAPSPLSNGHYGSAVATDGANQIAVAESGTRRVYLYSNASGSWRYQGALSDPDNAAAGEFGCSVAVRDGDVAVGDCLDDHTGTTNAGAVYVTDIDADEASGDSCAEPLPVPAADYTGCTSFATPSPQQATTCGGSQQGPDVWFAFTPQCDGNAIFDTYGSSFDTVLSVHSSCPTIFGNNTIVCNDDASFAPPNNRASLVTFNFTGGTTYLVRVSGYNGAAGAFVLRHLFTYGSTPNDNCAQAQQVALGSTPFANCGAGSAALSTSCASTVYNDLWYRYTAQEAGSLEINTCGSSFDTVLTVYNGTPQSCPNSVGAEIACNDDTIALGCTPLSSKVTVQTTPGQNLLIRVAGYWPSSRGPGTLFLGYDCPADFNNSGGTPDDADIAAFFAAWNAGDPIADLNNSGGTPDDADVAYFFQRWNAGC